MKRLKIYQDKLNRYEKEIKKHSRKLDFVSNLRLAIVAIGFIMVFYTYFYVDVRTSWVVLFTSLLVFIIMVKVYNKFKGKVLTLVKLAHINSKNIERVQGKWTDFEDDGSEFICKEHPFSYDLDVFGKGSLFQWINTGVTTIGRKKLKNALASPVKDKDTIVLRQHAVEELAREIDWRQQFNSLGLLLNSSKEEVDIKQLFNVDTSLYKNKIVVFFIRLLPAITIGLLIASYGIEAIPRVWGATFLILQFIVMIIGAKSKGRFLGSLSSINSNIRIYSSMLRLLEDKRFTSVLLKDLQVKVQSKTGQKGYVLIKQFNNIVERSANRDNLFFFPINVLLLWDFTTLIKLERWKLEAGSLLENMIDVVGDVECLSSLGQMSYDNDNWVMPKLETKSSVLTAKKLGHPLLGEEKVSNDVILDKSTPMLLITGSNMSGKSTWLRTVGVNMILAYAGAPVCAKEMEVSLFELHTSMRISDNLEKSISSFYGELLRIKGILEANKENRAQSLVLLDEIFKGTNSYDRHIGAKALIKKLLQTNCMGLVSTHDLELEILEEETKGIIKNYHFQEYYINDEIKFDYKLKVGVSKTRNALYLLKLIGIEI